MQNIYMQGTMLQLCFHWYEFHPVLYGTNKTRLGQTLQRKTLIFRKWNKQCFKRNIGVVSLKFFNDKTITYI